MKRAEVYQNRRSWSGAGEKWLVHLREGVINDRNLAIGGRSAPDRDDAPFPTHAAALAHALEAVGLASKETP